MKVATFTVHATEGQSARWKQAAQAEGYSSAGSWLAQAADTYLRQLAKSGLPRPLAWRRASFKAQLLDGREHTVRGSVSPPFGIFRGGPTANKTHGPHTLVYLPTGAAPRHAGDSATGPGLGGGACGGWVRWEGKEEPGQDAAAVLAPRRGEGAS